MARHFLILVLLASNGCAALGESREFKHTSTSTDPHSTEELRGKAYEPCRVYIVDKLPVDDAKRVGSIDVPADLAKQQRMDPNSLSYACDVEATHALKEDEHKNKKGQLVWKMGLYHVPRSIF